MRYKYFTSKELKCKMTLDPLSRKMKHRNDKISMMLVCNARFSEYKNAVLGIAN